MRNRKKVWIGGGVLLGVLAVGASLLALQPGPDVEQSTQSSTAPQSSVLPKASQPPEQESSSTPAPPAPGDIDAPSLEVPAAGEAASPALPPSKPVPPLIAFPAPPSASANGELAPGYPATLVIAPHSSIITSSVASEGDRVQLSLLARSTGTAEEVLDHYAHALAAFGYINENPSATPGAGAVTFVGAQGSVSVAANLTAAGTEYAVFASLSKGS